jgi:hypothetical protein
MLHTDTKANESANCADITDAILQEVMDRAQSAATGDVITFNYTYADPLRRYSLIAMSLSIKARVTRHIRYEQTLPDGTHSFTVLSQPL